MLAREDVKWQFADAGGIDIHYGERGSGHPVLLLHGTGPGSDAWGNYRHNIGPLSESFRTIAVDLPRFGKSAKVQVTGPRLDYLSGVIRDFMDSVGIDTAHVVGNSMGGQIAMKLAIDRPNRIDKLVLIAPAVAGHSVFTPMPTEGVGQIAKYYKDDGPSLDKMERLLKSLAYDPAIVTDEMVQERYRASTDPEVLAVNKGPHWDRQSLEGELEQCMVPTLIVWGQDDRASALDHGLLLLRKLPDARLHVFARCGHWAQVEHADEFNRLALDFFDDRVSD
jgi:4,5:9,10-diseco-3-hydroxy-5,9,17-trioxoandrosta-1(10),2-diene-4-oate hydrolase